MHVLILPYYFVKWWITDYRSLPLASLCYREFPGLVYSDKYCKKTHFATLPKRSSRDTHIYIKSYMARISRICSMPINCTAILFTNRKNIVVKNMKVGQAYFGRWRDGTLQTALSPRPVHSTPTTGSAAVVGTVWEIQIVFEPLIQRTAGVQNSTERVQKVQEWSAFWLSPYKSHLTDLASPGKYI